MNDDQLKSLTRQIEIMNRNINIITIMAIALFPGILMYLIK